jgi:hypothetical protein
MHSPTLPRFVAAPQPFHLRWWLALAGTWSGRPAPAGRAPAHIAASLPDLRHLDDRTLADIGVSDEWRAHFAHERELAEDRLLFMSRAAVVPRPERVMW